MTVDISVHITCRLKYQGGDFPGKVFFGGNMAWKKSKPYLYNHILVHNHVWYLDTLAIPTYTMHRTGEHQHVWISARLHLFFQRLSSQPVTEVKDRSASMRIGKCIKVDNWPVMLVGGLNSSEKKEFVSWEDVSQYYKYKYIYIYIYI